MYIYLGIICTHHSLYIMNFVGKDTTKSPNLQTIKRKSIWFFCNLVEKLTLGLSSM